MPDDALALPADPVLRHARSVDELADHVRRARAAAPEDGLDLRAYGHLCQFLPALLNPLCSLATGALYDAEDALRETSLKLRAVVAETTSTDDTVASMFGRPGAP